MTFDDILAQVLELLQREGRVSYRALKLRFDINDDYIEGIKDELIYAKKLAVDDANRVLVWVGGPALASELSPVPGAPACASAPAPDQERDPLSYTPKHLAEKILTSRSALEGERKQVTVLFCDLANSTPLAERLGSEHMHTLLNRFFELALDAVHRYEGTINQFLGDGLLLYFGYPQAHEDDAQRAVRTGLGILDAMGDLNQGLQQAQGIQLALHIGIHTGLVVVGEMGGVGRQEQLALGEVPNVCSRIQGLAAPNTVAISEATYRLAQGYFDYEALGEQTLRGVAQPFQMYHVLQESGARGRLDVAVTRGLSP